MNPFKEKKAVKCQKLLDTVFLSSKLLKPPPILILVAWNLHLPPVSNMWCNNLVLMCFNCSLRGSRAPQLEDLLFSLHLAHSNSSWFKCECPSDNRHITWQFHVKGYQLSETLPLIIKNPITVKYSSHRFLSISQETIY